jgi:hypothetical protein
MTDGGDAARESRPLAGVRTDDLWPVLGLIALAGAAWVVTADRMQGSSAGTRAAGTSPAASSPAPRSTSSRR